MLDGSTALERFIRWVMRDTVYSRVYAATVIVQTGSTVDLLPESEELSASGLQGVPVMYGAPGVEAMFPPGTKMLLIFQDGRPDRPLAICFDGAAILLKLGGGSSPVARVGDQISLTSATCPAGACTGVGIITGGSSKVLA